MKLAYFDVFQTVIQNIANSSSVCSDGLLLMLHQLWTLVEFEFVNVASIVDFSGV